MKKFFIFFFLFFIFLNLKTEAQKTIPIIGVRAFDRAFGCTECYVIMKDSSIIEEHFSFEIKEFLEKPLPPGKKIFFYFEKNYNFGVINILTEDEVLRTNVSHHYINGGPIERLNIIYSPK